MFYFTGVVALAFTLISFVSGIITLFSAKVRLMVKNGPVKILHISVGIFAVSMGLITIVLGLNGPYFRTSQGGLATALMTFVILILFYVLIQPITDLISATRKSL